MADADNPQPSSSTAQECPTSNRKTEDKSPSPKNSPKSTLLTPSTTPSPPSPRQLSPEQRQQLESIFNKIQSRPSWQKLDQFFPREHGSWSKLPDSVCDDIHNMIICPGDYGDDLSSPEKVNAAIDLLFLRHQGSKAKR